MSTTIRAGARRTSTVIAALGVLLATLLVASPAHAAPVVDLSASDTTITLGESVTLTWTTTDSTTLTAADDWSGDKNLPDGSESVTPTETGTFTYTLIAGSEEDPDSSDSVEVTVVAGPITPDPVTFPDECTVVIPDTENVTYYVDYGDDEVDELEAGTYDGLEFSDPETPVTFFVEANDGFTLADDAVTEWDYTASESCFELGPTIVTTVVTCGAVRFTNTTDGPVVVLYGGAEEEQEDGEFTLAAGASRTVNTPRDEFLFIAFGEDEIEEPAQIRFLDVPQDCGDGDGDDDGDDDNDHPTVAPAAGVTLR